MVWTRSVIRDHKETAARLTKIMLAAFGHLRANPRATEGQTKDFILAELKKNNIVMDKPFATPIVAFGNHAADPHYHPVPGTRRLAPGTLVMIDIWGRMKGKHQPYADITWMGYFAGKSPAPKIPKETRKVFDAVIAARDACVGFVRREARARRMPVGSVANEAANKVIRKRGYGKFIKHSTGHNLGFVSPHGRHGRNLNRKNKHPLLKNIGYTIEPGVYVKGKLGVRSEMNFYVDAKGKFVVTTPLQRRLVMI